MKKTHISHGEHWEAFVLRDRVNSEELYTHYFNIFYWILKKLRAKNSRLVKLQRETENGSYIYAAYKSIIWTIIDNLYRKTNTFDH